MIDPARVDFTNTPISGKRPKFTYAAVNSQPSTPPLVSLITTLSADSGFLAETAASVFGQSMQQWEWIVAGSLDSSHSKELVCLGREERRVRIVTLSDASGLRNDEAARLARAPVIAFLSCGDLLEPTALEKLSWFLDSHRELSLARAYIVGFGSSNHRLLREANGDRDFVMFRRSALIDGETIQNSSQANRRSTVPEFLSWLRTAGDQNERNIHCQADQISASTHKRRLLMLAPHFEIGGADKFNLDLIECLQRQHGYEVSVVTTRSSAHRWRARFEHLTPDVFTLHTFLHVEDYPRFVSHLIESRKPDTVLITNCRTGYECLPLFRMRTKPSFVDYLHIEDADPQGYPQLSLNYAAFLDATIVSSEHMKRKLVEAGRDGSQIQLATTNIDPRIWDRSRFEPDLLRTKYGVPAGVPVITFAGRLCSQKQPDVMARVIRTIRDRGLDFVCLVAGDGEYVPWLQKFIQQHDLQQLKLLGARQTEEVAEILAISDILFLPSADEGIALTLFEAMSMGVTPVAADVGGQRELVSGDCGVLVQHGASETTAYANALERLLKDRESRVSMGARSRSRILAHFTLDKMGETMAQIFDCAAKTSTFNPAFADVPGDSKGRAGAEQPGVPARFWSTLLFVSSPRNLALKLRNLALLARIFLNPDQRLLLNESFDARYYLAHQPDVRARGICPLLHYSLAGYREDRLPTAHFDETGREGPDPQIPVNPLLWSIAHGVPI